MSGPFFLNLFGGLGLFLLGMSFLTDGLKEITGPSLKALLSRHVRGAFRAIAFGAGLTATVQSSSAAILAVMGFVNAGLLELGQAVGIVYGANLGTTFTAWIVSILGFKVEIAVFALPAVGAGAFLRLFGTRKKHALGMVLAGFGLLFLGIETMGTGLESDAARAWLLGFGEYGGSWKGRILFVGVGVLATAIMQSSSAVLAITLTALAAGTIDLSSSAALTVGSNIGTTVTALLAAIGAETDARRTAAAHIIFNLVTAGLTLAIFDPFLELTKSISGWVGITEPPSLLAVHSALSRRDFSELISA